MAKELVTILEKDQPFCNRRYGVNDATGVGGLCPALLGESSDQKCFQTRKTCPVPSAYDIAAYVKLLGSPGQFISAAVDNENLSLVMMDITIRLAMNTWTPIADTSLVSKWWSAGNQRSFDFGVAVTSGQLFLRISADGTTTHTTATSGVATGFAANSAHWVRVIWRKNNGAGNHDFNFYTSEDNYTWTQLGSTTTGGAGPTLFNSTTKVEIGSRDIGAAQNLIGNVYEMAIRNFDLIVTFPDPVSYFRTSDAEASTTGDTTLTSRRTSEVWNINGGLTKLFRGAKRIRFVTKQAGTQRYYNAMPSVNSVTVDPGTLNIVGLDGGSEGLFGQREVCTANLDNHTSPDVLVDPYRLERQTGVALAKYLSLPGSSGNYASTPDSAQIDITGDLTLRAKIRMNDWTPGSIACVLAKWGAAGQRSYKLEVLTTGKLRFSWSNDGTTVNSADSTVALPNMVDGVTVLWLAAAIDVNNGAAGRNIAFAYLDAFNPLSGTPTFTVLGSLVTQATVTSIFNSNAALTVGTEADGSTGVWAGRAYYANVTNVLSFETPVFTAAFDLSDALPGATTTTNAFTGETWTINQSGSPKAEVLNLIAPYDPNVNGTYWGKWISRNQYFSGIPITLYEGEMGQALSQMVKRFYVLDRVDGPSNGRVSLIAKDTFATIAARKAVWPRASKGELFADITNSATSFTLNPSGIGNSEYPTANFYVCIGEEILFVGTRSGDSCTSVTRGQLGTTADAHKDEDLVQVVQVYTSNAAKDIAMDVIGRGAGVPVNDINLTSWSNCFAGMAELYTTRLARPEPVAKLLGELQEQVGFTTYVNTYTGLVEFSAIRSTATVATIIDESWVVGRSMSVKRQDQRRVSQCWFYYGQKNPTKDLDEKNNYFSRVVSVDLTSEGDDQYGSASIKEIFSRWVPQFGRSIALNRSGQIVANFRDPPLQAEFRVNGARERQIFLSAPVTIRTQEIEDFYGARQDTAHIVTRIQRDVAKDELAVRTLQVQYGPTVAEKTIAIENDANGINFRTEYNKQFLAPVAGDTVKCIISPGIYIGSLGSYSFDVGDWPVGVTVLVQVDGVIEGIGGAGGYGGSGQGGNQDEGIAPSTTAGGNGEPGGPAFRTQRAITLSGTGRISGGWGGGGGGGGAAGQRPGWNYGSGGGGGGSGRGLPPGVRGPGGFGSGAGPINNTLGQDGTNGTRDAQGLGGQGHLDGPFQGGLTEGGDGGDGNANGTTGTTSGMTTSVIGTAGTVGARGFAITGNSLITFSGWTGTVDGPTTG